MVRLLALDTSSAFTSVALLNHTTIIARNKHSPMQHGHAILPIIQALFQETSLTCFDLDGVVFGCGPGSFTGTRIASCVAQGLACIAGCPVMLISSLAAFAQTVYLQHQWTKLHIILDAQMGKVYSGVYQINASGYAEVVGKERLCKEKEIDSLDAGEGWREIRGDQHSKLFPSAEALLALLQTKHHQENWVSPTEALPVYLC